MHKCIKKKTFAKHFTHILTYGQEIRGYISERANFIWNACDVLFVHTGAQGDGWEKTVWLCEGQGANRQDPKTELSPKHKWNTPEIVKMVSRSDPQTLHIPGSKVGLVRLSSAGFKKEPVWKVSEWVILKLAPVFLHECWSWFFSPHLEECWLHSLIAIIKDWRATLFCPFILYNDHHSGLSLWPGLCKWRWQIEKK